MRLTIRTQSDGWYLEEEKLPLRIEALESYRSNGYWADKTLGDMVEEAARKWPARIALASKERRLSFLELDQLSTRLAQGFLEIGLRTGDMVAVQLPNSIEHVLTIFALGKIGAVCNIIVPLMREKEVSHILNHCKSKCIIIPREHAGYNHLDMVRRISGSTPSLQTVIVLGEADSSEGVTSFDGLLSGSLKKDYAPDHLRAFRPSPDAVSLVGFTSGTTAQPKAYLHTHNTEYFNSYCCALADALPFLGRPAVNIALPGFAWMYGRICNVHGGVIGGATTVIVDRMDPDTILAAVKAERPTHIHAAPAVYRSLVEGLLSLDDDVRSNLAVINYAGSTIPHGLASQLRGICDLVTCYGLSEVSPICSMSIMDSPEAQKYASGRPSWGNKVRIIDEKGAPVGLGEAGEIAMTGPGLFLGYLGQPEETAKAFLDDGFFRTGDSGFFDEALYLNITGRIKDVIDRGGVKFSAREVEELILAHPKVRDVAIVGAPDKRLGEKACAFVVTRDGVTLSLEELVAFLRQKGIATQKFPERLENADELPYTPTGKLKKFLLRERIAKIISDEERQT